MRLTVRAVVPGLDQAGFQKAAGEAKNGCPISNLMKGNVPIEPGARLT
jgi:organic hydroperoxide reductase OsmC/OhrA